MKWDLARKIPEFKIFVKEWIRLLLRNPCFKPQVGKARNNIGNFILLNPLRNTMCDNVKLGQKCSGVCMCVSMFDTKW